MLHRIAYKNQKLRPGQKYLVVVTDQRDKATYIAILATKSDGHFPPIANSVLTVTHYDCDSTQLVCPEEFLLGISYGIKRVRDFASAAYKEIYLMKRQ